MRRTPTRTTTPPLSNFYLTFGDIMSTDFAIGCLKRNTRAGLVAAE